MSHSFPQHVAEIAARRARDVAFDEICCDFEDLHRRIPAVAHAHGDMLSTLHELKAEIRLCLGISPYNSGDP